MIELVNRLEKIAETNGTAFDYAVWIDPRAGKHKQFEFVFICRVMSDDTMKCFVAGTGPTIETAVEVASKNIPAAVKIWKYAEKK